MEEKHIAMCGLECSACGAFIATKNNDNKLKEKTAKEWTERYKVSPPLKAEDINCEGCLSRSGTLYRHPLMCEIRKCGLAKGINDCRQCNNYKCEKLTELQSQFSDS